MVKKWLVGLFLMLSVASLAFAQNTKKRGEINWEFLEVSNVTTCSIGNGSKDCRLFNYLTSGVSVSGQTSLEWMKDSNWELVGVVSSEQYSKNLYFKRQFGKERTEKEIEWLKKEYNKELQTKGETNPDTLLVDLDTAEANRKLDDFNNAEEIKLRTALEKIKDLPLKIISISSKSKVVGRTGVGAEIVLDATSVLLKDGNKYRSSDANSYFKESVTKILDNIGASSNDPKDPFEGGALWISRGGYKPVIENFYVSGEGLTLKVSVIVNYKGKQIIAAQRWIFGKFISKPQ